jgi:uncharacterized membrane protein YhhN
MDLRKHTPFNLILYMLVLVGTIAGEMVDSRPLVLACKPLLMIVLSSWFFHNSRRVGDRFTLLIQAGLFFSLIGDIALMLQHVDQFNFLVGLGAFLIAQLCYAMAFIHNITETEAERPPYLPIAISAALIIPVFLLMMEAMPRMDELLRLPVVVYAGAITVMTVAAAFRYGRTFPSSFLLVLLGALLFMTSDGILAWNRFIRPIEHASWSVMATYGVAQVLIAWGCLLHVLDPEELRRKAALST